VRFESALFALRVIKDCLYNENSIEEILRLFEIALKFTNLDE
jgi:hypothetical protein